MLTYGSLVAKVVCHEKSKLTIVLSFKYYDEQKKPHAKIFFPSSDKAIFCFF